MTLEGKTVLVTGATGFLGGALARRLASEGAHVKALARRPDRDRYIRDVDGIEIVMGDVTDAQRMREVVQGCDFVFHAAATTEGSLEAQGRVNVEGTRNVMQAAAEVGVQRVVHVSTVSVYGYRNRGDVTEDMPPVFGREPYGRTKAEGEMVVREVGAETGLSYSIIRPGMIYGPHSATWTKRLFNMAKRKLTIFIGDGSGSTFPIYVDDVVDLTLLLATHLAADGEAFNCTPDPSPTWREFLGAYSALVGHDGWLGIPPVVIKPIVWLLSVTASDQNVRKDLPQMLKYIQSTVTFRTQKARDLLGWQPKVSLEEGIQKCVPYLREKGLLS